MSDEQDQQKKHEPWYDEDKVDEMAMALLWLTAFQQRKTEPWRAWKGMDWDVLDRLEDRGLIYNSRTAKSVVLTDEGLERCRNLFKQHFGTPKAASIPPRPEREQEEANEET